MTPETKHTLTNLAVTLLLCILALMAVIGSGVIVFSPPSFLSGSTDEDLKEIRAKIHERDIIDFTVLENGEVQYSYIGARLPDKLAADEIVEKRTADSYTRNLGTDNAGNPTFNLITYSRPVFTQKDDVWYEIEYAQVPADIFYKEYVEEIPLSFIFGRTARADTIYAGAGDGFIGSGFFGTWAGARDATTGSTADSTGATMDVSSANIYAKADSFSIGRMFLPFVTSAIPASAVITSASLNVYVNTKSDGDNDAEAYITLVRTSQATHTTLVVADYDNITTTEGIDSGERKDITGISTGAYLTFTLNATGISWIAKSGTASNCSATAGITCLGLREGHDNTNTPIAGFFSYNNNISVSSSEASGTSQDPYLSVIYTDFSFWQFFGF